LMLLVVVISMIMIPLIYVDGDVMIMMVVLIKSLASTTTK